MVTLLPEATRKLGVPRTLHFPRPLGTPIGRPGDRQTQAHDLELCLQAAAQLGREEMAEYNGDELSYPV
ncbi:MAG TPA: hypothetical protein EYG16_10815 [Deltaproteobacteria bacterium]|nr:hypothetical protein [Candidatus Binatota bacterium]HIL14150.1 hypothetical protein [Deltaproteobacteria bacterium]